MRRRDFIGVLGGAVAWPLSVHSQQAKPVIGFLRSGTANGSIHLAKALQRGLSAEGMVEGRNVEVIYRYADGNRDRLEEFATELVRRKVNVIVANTVAAHVAKSSASSVPIVFVTGTDPVKSGLVNSFSRPEGNVTGVVFAVSDLTTKRFGLLHELLPNSGVIAVLTDPNGPAHATEVRETERAGRAIGRKTIIVKCATTNELPGAFETIVQARAVALFVGGGAFFLSQRDMLVTLAARYAVPAIFAHRQYAESGGLISYGPSQRDAYRQAGEYAGRIIKGIKPTDLPIMQSSTFELVINAKTAKSLGLSVPDKLIAIADELVD